jgi:hypothetical protein
MESQKENKTGWTVRYRTVRYLQTAVHKRQFHIFFPSAAAASAAFVVGGAAALTPAAATVVVADIASVIVADAVCMCVCACVCVDRQIDR